MNELRLFAQKCLIASLIGSGVILVWLALWVGSEVVFLVFAGILLALFLRGLADRLQKHTGLSDSWALAATIAGVCLLAVGFAFWMVPSLSAQMDQMIESLPKSLESLRDWLGNTKWGREVLGAMPAEDSLLAHPAAWLGRVQGAFSLTFGVVLDLLIVLFLGLFLSAEPRIYREGLIRLAPVRARAHLDGVLEDVGVVLRSWLLARASAMIIVGILVGLGLWALSVPLALPLAVIATVLGFIPNLGPILSALPAVLIALLLGPSKALYVGLLYLVVQSFEGYVLTPLLQRSAIAMPPALLIASQIFLGLIFGFPGLLLATPLTAMAIVLVRRFYRGDVLHDPAAGAVEAPAEHAAKAASAPPPRGDEDAAAPPAPPAGPR